MPLFEGGSPDHDTEARRHETKGGGALGSTDAADDRDGDENSDNGGPPTRDPTRAVAPDGGATWDLVDLPPEVVTMILAHVDTVRDFKAMELVSRAWNRMLSYEGAARALCERVVPREAIDALETHGARAAHRLPAWLLHLALASRPATTGCAAVAAVDRIEAQAKRTRCASGRSTRWGYTMPTGMRYWGDTRVGPHGRGLAIDTRTGRPNEGNWMVGLWRRGVFVDGFAAVTPPPSVCRSEAGPEALVVGGISSLYPLPGTVVCVHARGNARWVGRVAEGRGRVYGLWETRHARDGVCPCRVTSLAGAEVACGARFLGRWRGHHPDRGTLVYTSGHVYEGAFEEGLFHGQGTLVMAGGRAVYVGRWKRGLPHGRGTMRVDDPRAAPHRMRTGRDAQGWRYEGHWRYGVRHGHGVQTWADGGRYVGRWARDRPHGEGSREWPDGSRYEGEWRRGKPHGRGACAGPGGRGARSGFWIAGERCSPMVYRHYERTGRRPRSAVSCALSALSVGLLSGLGCAS
jgi:hypothetical protein